MVNSKELDQLIPMKFTLSRILEQGVLRRRPAAVLGCLLVLSALPVPVWAKQKQPPTKTIQGKVLDASSGPIVGAAVQLTDVTSGKTLAMYSEAGGRYAFTELKPNDDYQVQATYNGQQSEIRKASSLDGENLIVLDLTIPASASQ